MNTQCKRCLSSSFKIAFGRCAFCEPLKVTKYRCRGTDEDLHRHFSHHHHFILTDPENDTQRAK